MLGHFSAEEKGLQIDVCLFEFTEDEPGVTDGLIWTIETAYISHLLQTVTFLMQYGQSGSYPPFRKKINQTF